jgi:biopolymer transport protein ExbD
MAKRGKLQHGEDLDINMTPMIDCTFLLIIFFILTSQFASQALATLEVYKPWKPQTKTAPEDKIPDRIIVNVVSEEPVRNRDVMLAGEAKHYEIVGKRIDIGDTASLNEAVKAAQRTAVAAGVKPEDFRMEIRADQDVEFQYVEPVLLVGANAGIVKMEITARRASPGD